MATVTLVGLALLIALAAVVVIVLMDWLPVVAVLVATSRGQL